MLPCHTNHLFNIRIDMGDAGNLSFQHLTVKYSNGPLFWEYELYKKTVNLPELLQGAGSRKFNGSERAMNRRFSLSLKKNENIKLPQGIKRTYSLSQLKGRQ